METPANDGSILLLDTKCSPNPNSTISTSVFRKPAQTNHYLYWNSKHPILAKTTHPGPHSQRKNVYSIPQFLAKEMDYLNRILLQSSDPYWIIKNPERTSMTTTENPDTGSEVNKSIFLSVPYVPGLSEQF